MRNLSSLLERLANTLNKDTVIKEKIMRVIEQEAGVRLVDSQILLKDGVLELNSSPVVHSEIRLRESKIKDSLKSEDKIFISRILYK